MTGPHTDLLKLIVLTWVPGVLDLWGLRGDLADLAALKLILWFVACQRFWKQFVGRDLGEGQLLDEVVDKHFPGLFDSRQGLLLLLQVFLQLLNRSGFTLCVLAEVEIHVGLLFLRSLER